MTNDTHSDGTRVLFVSDHFGHKHGVVHGATRYFLSVLPRLAGRVGELHVAFLRGDHPASIQLKDAGVTHVFFGRSKWSLLPIRDLHRMVKRHRIQVIHSAGMKGILTARVVGRLTGVPVICHLHDSEPVPKPMRYLLRRTAPWSRLTLAVSHDVAEHAHKTLGTIPDNTQILLNGLPLDQMRSTPTDTGAAFRKQHGLLPDAEVIGCIGRLAPVKGQDTLLRAMPAILAKHPNARLLIVGEGPSHKALQQRTHELGLDGYVTFTGQIPNVFQALHAIDIVAMPSLREGLPYALLEAMAMDKPVVASAVGGLAETIRHCENGVLVRPNDAQALANALISLLDDPLLVQTVTQGAHETVMAFDVDHHVDRLVTIYHALASGQPVPEPDHAPAQDAPRPAHTAHADAPIHAQHHTQTTDTGP